MKRIKKLKALPLCLKGFLAAFTLHRIRSMLILFGIIFSINDVCNGLLMDLISTTLTLGIEPYQELSSVRKEMCISRCHYQPRKCLSLSLEGSPERLVCRFYNATFDVGPMVKHTGRYIKRSSVSVNNRRLGARQVQFDVVLSINLQDIPPILSKMRVYIGHRVQLSYFQKNIKKLCFQTFQSATTNHPVQHYILLILDQNSNMQPICENLFE